MGAEERPRDPPLLVIRLCRSSHALAAVGCFHQENELGGLLIEDLGIKGGLSGHFTRFNSIIAFSPRKPEV
jgi:hypothetical protein